MTFCLCCCCCSELLFPVSCFDLTGGICWSEMGKVMMSPRSQSSAVQVGWWSRLVVLLCPRGQSAAVSDDAALPNTSPQVLAGSWSSLLSGLAAVARLAAVHTLCASARYIFTLHNLFYTPQLHCEILKCPFERAAVLFIFLNHWKSYLDVCFKGPLWGIKNTSLVWQIFWGHFCIEFSTHGIKHPECVALFVQEANLNMRGCSCLVQKADIDNLNVQLKQNLEVFWWWAW